MSKVHFQNFLNHENFSRVHFYKLPELTVETITDADAQKLAETLVAKMSPENLTCDGELSRAQVQARVREYTGAAEYIKSHWTVTQPEWDDTDLFGVKIKPEFKAGQAIAVNHPKVGGRVTGSVVKVNRTRVRIDLGARGVFNVSPELLEII